VGYDGDDVERFVSVDGVRGGLEVGEFLSDRGSTGEDVGVESGEDGSKLVGSDGFEGGGFVEFVSSSNEGSGSGVGEEFLLDVVGGDDGDGGGAREEVEEVLDLSKLELGSVSDPGFLHEVVVFL